MIGWDFLIFWQIGDAVLRGVNPYTSELIRYPPATAVFFSIFALIPYSFAFPFWTGLNVILYVDVLRKMHSGKWLLLWFFFTPALFDFLTGQIDFLFFWLTIWLPKGGWKAVLAAVCLTLKPQLALVILPWFLIEWFSHEKTLLIKWAGLSLCLHLTPLLVDLDFYSKWLVNMKLMTISIIPLSSGLFSLTVIQFSSILLSIIGLVSAIWGLSRDEKTSRAAQLFSFPFTRWYDGVILSGTAPAYFLVPYSWAAFLLAYLLKSNIPLATIPLAVLIWRFARKEISSRAT